MALSKEEEKRRKRLRDKRRQEYCHEHHLCVRCGKPIDTNDKHLQCHSCREKMNKKQREKYRSFTEAEKSDYRQERKRDYEYLKKHGICVKCGTRRAMPKHVLCDVCAEKDRKRNENRNALMTEEEKRARLDHWNKVARERKRRYKENGLCILCGKKALEGKSYCLECLIKTRRWALAKYYRKKEKRGHVKTDFSPGLCSKCNEPALPGKKLCKRHYESAIKGLDKALACSPFRKMTTADVLKARARS